MVEISAKKRIVATKFSCIYLRKYPSAGHLKKRGNRSFLSQGTGGKNRFVQKNKSSIEKIAIKTIFRAYFDANFPIFGVGRPNLLDYRGGNAFHAGSRFIKEAPIVPHLA